LDSLPGYHFPDVPDEHREFQFTRLAGITFPKFHLVLTYSH